MNQMIETRSYQEFKQELDGELSRAAESFVRIGYLLKVARDTDILRESGYATVTEFAAAEYGIDKTQVSRFIHINDKFSEGGYGASLMQQYQGYGYAKLTIMLQLPEEITEELTPDYTKAEIQAIKDEVDAEAKVTEIEHMLEEVPEQIAAEENTLKRILLSLGEAEPELYKDIHMQAERWGWEIELLKDDMMPDGEHSYSVRVPGEGRYLLMLGEDGGSYMNMRAAEKQRCSWQEILDIWRSIMNIGIDAKEDWSHVYGKPLPEQEKQEVAPVQPRKESRVTKAKEEKPVPKMEPEKKVGQTEPVQEPGSGINTGAETESGRQEESSQEQQADEDNLPGQARIEDYPEYLPDNEQGKQSEETPIEQTGGGPDPEEKKEELLRAVGVVMTQLQENVEAEDWSAVETMAHTLEHHAKRLQEIEGAHA